VHWLGCEADHWPPSAKVKNSLIYTTMPPYALWHCAFLSTGTTFQVSLVAECQCPEEQDTFTFEFHVLQVHFDLFHILLTMTNTVCHSAKQCIHSLVHLYVCVSTYPHTDLPTFCLLGCLLSLCLSICIYL